MFLLASHVIWGFINGLQGVIRSLNLSGEGEQSEVSYFGKWMKNNCEGAWVSAGVRCSAVKRSIGFTIGFQHHGEGPY